MSYVTKDKRDVYLYEFESKTSLLVLSFSNKDGLISHLKFLGDFIFYVRNTKDIIVIYLIFLNLNRGMIWRKSLLNW